MYISYKKDENMHSPIMKEISHIKFYTLKEINLMKNNILSVEGFHRIFAPSLKIIDLSILLGEIDDNKICCVKDLRKMIQENVDELNLSKFKKDLVLNKVNEGQPLAQGNIRIKTFLFDDFHG